MEPIQILEAIKEDIRDKFDGDPLMMRTMNLVITEYKARTERLHKPVVVRGAVTSHCISLRSDKCEFTNTCPECTKPATEPLPAEGSAKSVRVGCKNYDFHGSDILRYGRCAYCGNTE